MFEAFTDSPYPSTPTLFLPAESILRCLPEDLSMTSSMETGELALPKLEQAFFTKVPSGKGTKVAV